MENVLLNYFEQFVIFVQFFTKVQTQLLNFTWAQKSLVTFVTNSTSRLSKSEGWYIL